MNWIEANWPGVIVAVMATAINLIVVTGIIFLIYNHFKHPIKPRREAKKVYGKKVLTRKTPMFPAGYILDLSLKSPAPLYEIYQAHSDWFKDQTDE